MSNWTHVAGIIRFDSMRGMKGYLKENIKADDYTLDDFHNLIGKECLWGCSNKTLEDFEENPDDYLPMGSEGSLQLSLWINPEKDCSFSYVVSIFGDLRDHDDANEIIEWFKKKLKSIEKVYENNLFVRQATITANNEYNGTASWTYEDTNN